MTLPNENAALAGGKPENGISGGLTNPDDSTPARGGQEKINGKGELPDGPALVAMMKDGIDLEAVAAIRPEREPDPATDLGNARRLVDTHKEDLRYCATLGWLVWDGRRWKVDETGAIYRLAKRSVLSIYDDADALSAQALTHSRQARKAAEANDSAGEAAALESAKAAEKKAGGLRSWAKASQARGRIEAAVALAQSEAVVVAVAADFDADPWLFNCHNGTVDLKTGELQPHNRADMITKLSPVSYHPGAQAPQWQAFLARVMGDDPAMLDHLRRVVGYCLTGNVSEQALFFCHGSGANGKSTLLRALLAILGPDYAKQAAAEILTIQRDRHPTELADLAGARLIATIEVEEGKRMAESLVKQLTGGDMITARHLYRDPFQFEPTFKIVLAANHKPRILGTDYAIWRRIRLIPFDVTIPEAEQDRALAEKLNGELPGILAWAVSGCLDWLKDGLKTPEKVKAATEGYREESDLLGAFLADCTATSEKAQVQASALYEAYKTWANRNGETAITSNRFGRNITERGIDKYTDRHTRRTFYLGLELLADDTQEGR